MASCKLGHIYIVDTVLTKPAKEKFALCVCIADRYFVWINTNPAPHGKDQLFLPAGCHHLIKHDSYLDLSRIVCHPEWELNDAKEFPQISASVASDIVALIDAGLDVLSPRHAAIVRAAVSEIII